MWPAVKNGLITPIDETYLYYTDTSLEITDEKMPKKLPDTRFNFIHDRIQQSAYTIIPESKQPEEYYHLIRTFLQNLSAEEYQENIFTIAYFYTKAKKTDKK